MAAIQNKNGDFGAAVVSFAKKKKKKKIIASNPDLDLGPFDRILISLPYI